jgi:hypothetical protein
MKRKLKLNSGEAVGEHGRLHFRESGERSLRSLTIKGEVMKKNFFRAALTCGLLTVLAAATAYAQEPGTEVRARIPFDFSVRGKILPAGDYEIRRITDEPGSLIISSVNDRHERVAFETEPVEAPRIARRAEIVFQRYGDSYFLSEVFSGGLQTGRELFPSRQERVMKSEMASNKTESETVALAAY